MSIDNVKNKAFWDKAAKHSRQDKKMFAGMLMEGREFEAFYRCRAEEKHLLKILRPAKETRVLEIGSGGGRWGLFFADKVDSYIGLDLSAEMVRIAEEERSRRNLANIEFHCADLLTFSADEQFDLVYFAGVLQYMDDSVVLDCIQKATALLTEDGIIISRDSIQTEKRVERTGEYPVIYRTIPEYLDLFQWSGYQLEYSEISYPHKRFTGLAYRVYALPLATYGMAYALREVLCFVDNILGNPGFLKTRKHKDLLKRENRQEHRFFKYVRKL